MYLDRADVINSDFFLGLSKNQIAALGKAGMQDVELHSASLAFLYVGSTPKSKYNSPLQVLSQRLHWTSQLLFVM